MKDKLLKTLKVLLVEDEQNIALLFKDALAENFYKFYLAKDGVEGLEKFDNLSPDIVITDINMPRLSGLDMAKKIKEKNKNVPILILSAFSEKEKLFSAIDIGVVKYFLKPYDPDEILSFLIDLAPSLGEKSVKLEDDFVFNISSSALYHKSKFIALSKNELKFISLLIDSEIAGEKSIKVELWGEEVSDERLRTFIKRFRAKTSKKLVQNVKGIGYKCGKIV